MRERASRPQLIGLIIRVCDHAVEARDGVFEHRRQIVGEDSSGTGLQLHVRTVYQQHARAAVGGVGALKVTQDALDLALLGDGHRHVEVQPDHVSIEVLRGHKCAQLVEVAASVVDPAPERNRLTINASPSPVSEERNHSHTARAGLVEVRGLRRTGVNGRDGRTLGDVTERMRVTDREIVEPTMHARIATNREVGLIARYVERAAVDASDAYSRVTGFAAGKRHREVVLSCLGPARAGIEDDVRRKFIGEVIAINDMHPRRKLRSKRMTRRPHRLGRKRIVIARDQKNGGMRAASTAKRSGESLPEVRGGGRVVEQVTGA